ncbi:MAG: ISNCY family transposase [Terriglobales bacterium]
MLFPPKAVERAMQIKEVLLRAMNKEYSWLRAAEILGITPRGLRRLRERMERFGYQGLVDMRHGRPSPRRTAVAEVERILELYRERYPGFNGRHFWQLVRRDQGVTLSYTCVKQILQGAGLLKKRRARGRHRSRREPKACFGEMLHLDGSLHCWLKLAAEGKQMLIQVVDDATTRLLYAQLWSGETVQAVMSALKQVIVQHGIPASLYTDRAGWAFETPKAGEQVSKTHLTQVGQALQRLGIEHIPSYSPQARGRSERMNRTLQDRLVNELKAAGARTMEQANAYLQEHYITSHNQFLAREPREQESAFVPLGEADLDEILCVEHVRRVGQDNVVSMDGIALQLARQPGRATCAGLHVSVRRHLDGRYSIRRGTQLLGRYDDNGNPLTSTRPVESAGPVENRERPRFPTRTLDAGKRRRRPQLPQAPAAES